MRLIEHAGAQEAARAAADRLEKAARENPEVVLGLPTGRTMVPFYAELAARHRDRRIDLSRARGFNVDELVLPPGHPASFRAYMEEHAWERIGLPRERCEIPRSPLQTPTDRASCAGASAEALAAECARYDRAVEDAGGLDLLFLGLGADGHVAYNLPGEIRPRTHVVRVPAAVADTLPGLPTPTPLCAITLGFDALLAAREIVLLATTREKAEALQHLIETAEDPAWPCTYLHHHPHFEVHVTSAALAGVSGLAEAPTILG